MSTQEKSFNQTQNVEVVRCCGITKSLVCTHFGLAKIRCEKIIRPMPNMIITQQQTPCENDPLQGGIFSPEFLCECAGCKTEFLQRRWEK